MARAHYLQAAELFKRVGHFKGSELTYKNYASTFKVLDMNHRKAKAEE